MLRATDAGAGIRHAEPRYRLIKVGGIEFLGNGVDLFGEFDCFRDAGMAGNDRVHAVIATLQLRGERGSKTPGSYDAEIECVFHLCRRISEPPPFPNCPNGL